MSPAAGKAASSSYLVKGDDASLVAQEVRDLLAEVVGDRDQSRGRTSTWAPWWTPA
jgi:hypothetical protein